MRKINYLFVILSIVLTERIEGSNLNCHPTRQNYNQEKAGIKNVAKLNNNTTIPIIIGDDEFTEKTKSALSLIKKKAPHFYKLVIKYVSVIKNAEKNSMEAWANPPILEVDRKTTQSSLSWYASHIVHEAQHSKIYNDYVKKISVLLPVKRGQGERPNVLVFLFRRNFCEPFLRIRVK